MKSKFLRKMTALTLMLTMLMLFASPAQATSWVSPEDYDYTGNFLKAENIAVVNITEVKAITQSLNGQEVVEEVAGMGPKSTITYTVEEVIKGAVLQKTGTFEEYFFNNLGRYILTFDQEGKAIGTAREMEGIYYINGSMVSIGSLKWIKEYIAEPYPRAIKVIAGDENSFAISFDSDLYAWGNNGYGQLGTGDKRMRTTPVKIMAKVAETDSGARHTLAVTTNGVLYAWGDNKYGQLGLGDTKARTKPTKVMSGISKVVAGEGHSLALDAKGNLWVWGMNTNGQIGNGTRKNVSKPYKLKELGSNVMFIGGGGRSSYAMVDTLGNQNYSIETEPNRYALYSWGFNKYGQLGTGNHNDVLKPYAALKQASGGEFWANGTAVFARKNNDITPVPFVWGSNAASQLGAATTEYWMTPQKAIYHSGYISKAAMGWKHVLFKADGSDAQGTLAVAQEIYARGDNTYGQLGIGSFSKVSGLHKVKIDRTGIADFYDVAAGDYHSLLVDSSGKIHAWGKGVNGQLGNGKRLNSAEPIIITLPRP